MYGLAVGVVDAGRTLDAASWASPGANGLVLVRPENLQRVLGERRKPEERDEVRTTLHRARKALTCEERSVLEEAILAVQDSSQILTDVIMMDPRTALGMTSVKHTEDPVVEEGE